MVSVLWVKIIVAGYGIGDVSSNSRWGFLCYTSAFISKSLKKKNRKPLIFFYLTLFLSNKGFWWNTRLYKCNLPVQVRQFVVFKLKIDPEGKISNELEDIKKRIQKFLKTKQQKKNLHSRLGMLKGKTPTTSVLYMILNNLTVRLQ